MKLPATPAYVFDATRNNWPDTAMNDGSAGDILDPLKGLERALTSTADRSALLAKAVDRSGRPADCLIDQRTGTLAAYVRWLIILKVLLRVLQGASQSLLQVVVRYNQTGAVKRKLNDIGRPLGVKVAREEWRSLFGRTGAAKTPEVYLQGELFEFLAKVLSERLPGRHGKLTVHSILNVAADVSTNRSDPDALLRFEHWVLHGFLLPRDEVAGLSCQHYLIGPPSSERALQVERILSLLFRDSGPQPLINIYQRSGWSGLRAFATTLVQALLKVDGNHAGLRHRPTVVYVPMGRGETKDALQSPRELRRTLTRIFRRGNAVADADEQEPGEERSLDFVRLSLTLCRTVVIIDALDTSIGPMASLFDAIRNTQWSEVLSVLAQPHMGAYLSRGCVYPSTIVVLSSEPIGGIEPWRAVCEPLAKLPAGESTRDLLLGRQASSDELVAFCSQHRLQPPRSQLHELYGLDEGRVDALQRCGMADATNESELALASLLDPLSILGCHVSPAVVPGGGAPIESLRRRLFGRWLHRVAHSSPADFVALAFVAASINGMRYDTLRRSLRTWIEAAMGKVAPEAERPNRAHFDEFVANPLDHGIESLVKRYSVLLVEVNSEPLEAVEDRQLLYELQPEPERDELESGGGETHTSTTLMRMLDIRHNDVRELFFAEMASTAKRILPRCEGLTWQDTWQLIHLVLAEESLRQATTQLRNLPWRNFDTPASMRRLYQAVFHGLMSHSYGQEPEVQWDLQGALSPEPRQRFAFLYLFVFRHCIENAPEWTLGRAFGQTELRFALLTFFVEPVNAARILGQIHDWTSADRAMRRADSGARSDWLAYDPALRLDVMEAYGRAALDSGRVRIAKQIAEAVLNNDLPESMCDAAQAPHRSASDEIAVAEGALRRLRLQLQLLPATDVASATIIRSRHFGFRKLLIDALDFVGDHEQVRAHCSTWLTHAGLDVNDLANLARYFPRNGVVPYPSAKAALDEELQKRVNGVLRMAAGSRERTAIADMMGRLAEAVSPIDFPADGVIGMDAPLSAYSLYWIADSIRASARGGADRAAWPMISARPMRNYIRLCLAVARSLHSRSSANDDTFEEAAKAFMGTARRRLDAFSRHLFRLPRERAAMLLLVADIARTWAHLCRSQPKQSSAHLHACLDYIEEGHALLCELGIPTGLASRLYHDRAVAAGLLHKQTPHACWHALQQRDVLWLTVLSRQSIYWSKVLKAGPLGGTKDERGGNTT